MEICCKLVVSMWFPLCFPLREIAFFTQCMLLDKLWILTNQGYLRPGYLTNQVYWMLCYLTNQVYWMPMLLDKSGVLNAYVTWQIRDTECLCYLTNEGYLRPITWEIKGIAQVSWKHYRASDSFNYTFAINDLRQTKALKANKSYFVEAN